MSRLKSFKKFDSVDNEKSNKFIWIILSVLVFGITVILFSSYAKYVFTNDDITIANGVVPQVYSEELLNGADPVLSDNLIPITIDDNGNVYKANLYRDWYKYENKRWANAVVLRSSYDTLDSAGKVKGAIKNTDSVSLDGIDDIVVLGLENYEFDNGITMAVNFKMNSLGETVANTIIGNWENAGGGLYYYQGTIGANLYIKELNNYVYVSYPFNDTSNYHTAAVTFNGNSLKLYLDGKLVDSEQAIGTYNPCIMPFLLGGNPFYNMEGDPSSGVSSHENGNVNIKEYAIFDRVLTNSEINSSITERINITNKSGLLSYGNFDKNFGNNQFIPEDNIESYFVWIPKYSYQLWDLGNYSTITSVDNTKHHSIGIRFGITNTSDGVIGECTTPGIAGSSGNCVVGDYMTHPAFLAFDTNGLWVGKFETGYEGTYNFVEAEKNEVNIDKIIIKPNVYSWRANSIGNMFKNSYDYLRNDDSHMMKNTEWGAMAYLQHSVYGSAVKVRVNNNAYFVTGYSAKVEPTIGFNGVVSVDGNVLSSVLPFVDGEHGYNYLNTNSCISSTTANYYGVYDTSGGAWEYVMGFNTNFTSNYELSIISSWYSDFFINDIWKKYYDIYNSTNDYKYLNRILGDATGEMGPFENYVDPDSLTRQVGSWYKERSLFVDSTNPWFARSGYFASGLPSGIFMFDNDTGKPYYHIGYRIVLAPKN